MIATTICRISAKKEKNNSYNRLADEFEKLAVQIIDEFYQADPKACIKATIRQIPAYGNVTWLELAVAAEAKQFIAQRAVQYVLNSIWYGYIDQQVSVTAILFSTIMLPCSGFLRYHHELVTTNEQSIFLDVYTIEYIIYY